MTLRLMALVGLFAVGLFVCIASCFTSVWTHKVSLITLTLMILLLYPLFWIMLAGGVPVGIFGADMCQDIHPYLMNQTDNNNTRMMINYYLECFGENPFAQVVSFSTFAVQAAEVKLNTTIANNGSASEIAEIRAYISELGSLSVALVDVTNCETVHTPWKHVQENVCIDMIDALMVVNLASILAVVALCLMCCFSMCSWERVIRERADGYRPLSTEDGNSLSMN
eukprot:TRINITY_DN7693_c0_g1_i4.p1 TRINITY_DN7693_c0_g1~~TRINITY_DN7693_c0_g1_i4.p1  ORF type:complete len:225 (+),score=37.38 TRINITY_DN7693_c0_g1_i4:611-1285(+)